MQQLAAGAATGRPKKFGDEPSETIAFRIPKSTLDYLKAKALSAGAAAAEAVFFEEELTAALMDVLADLRISAALQGQSYEIDRAETIARLVKLGLSREPKPKR